MALRRGVVIAQCTRAQLSYLLSPVRVHFIAQQVRRIRFGACGHQVDAEARGEEQPFELLHDRQEAIFSLVTDVKGAHRLINIMQ